MFGAHCPWCQETGFQFGRRPAAGKAWYHLSAELLVCPHCGGLCKPSRANRFWILLVFPVLIWQGYSRLFGPSPWRVTDLDWWLVALAGFGMVMLVATMKWERASETQ